MADDTFIEYSGLFILLLCGFILLSLEMLRCVLVMFSRLTIRRISFDTFPKRHSTLVHGFGQLSTGCRFTTQGFHLGTLTCVVILFTRSSVCFCCRQKLLRAQCTLGTLRKCPGFVKSLSGQFLGSGTQSPVV